MSPDPKERRPKRPPPSGISLQTLVIAAAASVASAFLIARIWGPGTLFGAAAAPVIVAVVSEALRRPIQAVRPTPEAPPTPARGATAVREPADATPVPAGAVSTDSRVPTGRPGWRWALLTALIGFGIAVGVITVPDLISGSSITGNGRPTTFFGGATSTRTETVPAQTTLTTTTTVTGTTPTTTTATASTTTTTPAVTATTAPETTSTITTVTETETETETTTTTLPTPSTPSVTAPTTVASGAAQP